MMPLLRLEIDGYAKKNHAEMDQASINLPALAHPINMILLQIK